MKNTQNTDNQTLRVGQRFHYTGDMANLSTFGTITKVREDKGFGISYDVMYDEHRFEGDTLIGVVEHRSFICGGVGQRFFTLEAWKEVQRKARENFAKKFGNL